MSNRETVTFALPSGAKVTASKELASKLGWSKPGPKTKPAAKK